MTDGTAGSGWGLRPGVVGYIPCAAGSEWGQVGAKNRPLVSWIRPVTVYGSFTG